MPFTSMPSVSLVGPREAKIFRGIFVLEWVALFGVTIWTVIRVALPLRVGLSVPALVLAWFIGWKWGFGPTGAIVRNNASPAHSPKADEVVK